LINYVLCTAPLAFSHLAAQKLVTYYFFLQTSIYETVKQWLDKSC
jgi:hypothetical protein